MRICWDNLEGMKLNKKSNLMLGKNIYVEVSACKTCGEPFLATRRKNLAKYCNKHCVRLSKEHRNKISSSLTGHKFSKDSLLKMSRAQSGSNNPMYGKSLSEDHKFKISLALRGKFVGEKNTMYGRCGKLNPNWRGGKSFEPYCQIWKDSEFKEYIKDRDNNKCLNPYCDHNSNKLCIHHINYNKKDCDHSNLITLCVSCNSKANFDREWHTAWYKAIVNKRYGGFDHE